MSLYQQYKAEIARLQQEAQKVREQEIQDAREKILAIMREHGLTIADFGDTSNPPRIARKKARKRVEIKYRDIDTGKTWTGQGRVPKWLTGKDRKNYLVVSEDNFFVSDIREMEFHLLNYKPGIEEDKRIGLTPSHYMNKQLADEWRRKYIKKFHPDTADNQVANPEAVSEKINKIYNRLVGKA